jgi:DNA-directed RNA polymerase specialized sigma24 family protein
MSIIEGKTDKELYRYANIVYERCFNHNMAGWNREDMVQAAVLQAWLKRDVYNSDEHGSFNGWLWNLLKYTMMSQRKLTKHHDNYRVHPKVNDGMDRYYDSPTEDVIEDEDVESQKFIDRVLSGEFDLTKGQLSLLIGLIDKDMRQKDIAAEEGVTRNALGQRYNAAVDRIKQQLLPRKRPIPKLPRWRKRYLFLSPEGVKKSTSLLPDFCKKHGLKVDSLLELYAGTLDHHEGWTKFHGVLKPKKGG